MCGRHCGSCKTARGSCEALIVDQCCRRYSSGMVYTMGAPYVRPGCGDVALLIRSSRGQAAPKAQTCGSFPPIPVLVPDPVHQRCILATTSASANANSTSTAASRAWSIQHLSRPSSSLPLHPRSFLLPCSTQLPSSAGFSASDTNTKSPSRFTC